MASQNDKRAILGKALEDLVTRARSGREPCRIGLMAAGGEHSDMEFHHGCDCCHQARPRPDCGGGSARAWRFRTPVWR